MVKLIQLIKTYYLLGILNIIRVFYYRFRKKAGLYTPTCPINQCGEFFSEITAPRASLPVSCNWQEKAYYFGWHAVSLDSVAPPNWHLNPYNGYIASDLKPWFFLSHFDSKMGDIKWIWEASRFSWVLIKSQRASMGCQESLKQLNTWLSDWLSSNPPYLGLNWVCGQEASFRVLYLAMGSCILKQESQPSRGLLDFVLIHLKRISSTLTYAIGQDNNHGVSEAAALFVGGSWLVEQGMPAGKKHMKLGRKYLENRAKKLFMSDGGCSQYSVNYHALVLEIFCVVELWRKKLGLASFSIKLRNQLIAAMHWLRVVVDPITGDAPNIGANDGSRFFCLTDERRDYRLVVQLISALYSDKLIYDISEGLNEVLDWFDIEKI